MGYPTASLNSEQRQVSSRTPQPERPKFNGFEELLYLREAASLLGMHWKTLETMARARKVPALKVGKRWRFRASALNLWLEHGINSNATNHAALTGQE
jgi:excisionase family DNA binding protein